MNKQTSCQSDQAISVQIEEDYWKIHSLICWQKSLLSSYIDMRWLAGYFGCFTSPNFFFFFFLLSVNAEPHFSYVPSTGWLGFFGMIHNQLLWNLVFFPHDLSECVIVTWEQATKPMNRSTLSTVSKAKYFWISVFQHDQSDSKVSPLDLTSCCKLLPLAANT